MCWNNSVKCQPGQTHRCLFEKICMKSLYAVQGISGAKICTKEYCSVEIVSA